MEGGGGGREGRNKPANVNLRIKGSPLSQFGRNHKDAGCVLLPALSSEWEAALC